MKPTPMTYEQLHAFDERPPRPPRPTISEDEFEAACAAVPAPPGTEWCFDPAASSDRMRLFWDFDGPRCGEICIAYPDGSYEVDDPGEDYQFAAEGKEPSGGLEAAMRRALRVAEAVGWDFNSTETT